MKSAPLSFVCVPPKAPTGIAGVEETALQVIPGGGNPLPDASNEL